MFRVSERLDEGEPREGELLATRDGPHGGGDVHERGGIDMEGGIGPAVVAHHGGLGKDAVVAAVFTAQVDVEGSCGQHVCEAVLS